MKPENLERLKAQIQKQFSLALEGRKREETFEQKTQRLIASAMKAR